MGKADDSRRTKKHSKNKVRKLAKATNEYSKISKQATTQAKKPTMTQTKKTSNVKKDDSLSKN